jgi:hypothetical protein
MAAKASRPLGVAMKSGKKRMFSDTPDEISRGGRPATVRSGPVGPAAGSIRLEGDTPLEIGSPCRRPSGVAPSRKPSMTWLPYE